MGELRVNFLDTFWLAIPTRGVGAVAGLNPACLILVTRPFCVDKLQHPAVLYPISENKVKGY